MKLEDIEVEKLYAIRVNDFGCGAFCCQATAKDPQGTWVKIIAVDPEGGEAERGATARWVTSNYILATWVDYTTKQAEEQRARELARAAQQEMENSIRESLRTLGIDTFVDIEVDDSTEAVQIIVDRDDLATFTAELARAARQVKPKVTKTDARKKADAREVGIS